jgi:dTDP-glucose 4,6-dehydratase
VLLEEARRHLRNRPDASFRFVHVSTDEVFGSLGDAGRFSEASPLAPNSPYAASKAGADHLARAWFRTYGFPVITTNCSNNYGPYQFPEKLVPLTILNALDRLPLPVYGSGGNVRSWLHVEDHVDALVSVLAGGRPGETYLIGTPDGERSNLEVVTMICDAVDDLAGHEPGSTRRLIQFVTDRPGHDWRYAIDGSRVRDELGWRPAHSFATGLRETVAWYMAHRDWCNRVERGGFGRTRVGLPA